MREPNKCYNKAGFEKEWENINNRYNDYLNTAPDKRFCNSGFYHPANAYYYI